jgi:hypothetical protein
VDVDADGGRCILRGPGSPPLAAHSMPFTWVFLRTRGSALLVVLLHASINLFAVSPVVQEAGNLTG